MEAVALGGLWAREKAYPDSDVDLSIYYRRENPPQIAHLRLLTQELDDRQGKGRHLLLSRLPVLVRGVPGAGTVRVEEGYFVNVKGSVKAIDPFQAMDPFLLRAEDFAETARSVLAHPSVNPEQLSTKFVTSKPCSEP